MVNLALIVLSVCVLPLKGGQQASASLPVFLSLAELLPV